MEHETGNIIFGGMENSSQPAISKTISNPNDFATGKRDEVVAMASCGVRRLHLALNGSVSVL
jgi:hypothetical protein